MTLNSFAKWLLTLPILLVGLAMLIVLPFIVLMKGLLMSYEYGLSTAASLGIGTLATFIVLLVYLQVIDRVMRRRFIFTLKAKLIVSSAIVFSFVLYAMFVLNAANVKNRTVAGEYADLHPILRIGISTCTLLDPGLVITDMSRSIKDYKKMRVRAYRRSLHFAQKDGFVHAVDLRTKRRSKYRNWVTQTLFKLMGFGTIRHVGSADHLHVELILSKKAAKAQNRIARSRLAKKRKKTKRKKVSKKRSVAKVIIHKPIKKNTVPSASRKAVGNTAVNKLNTSEKSAQTMKANTRPKKKIESNRKSQTSISTISSSSSPATDK